MEALLNELRLTLKGLNLEHLANYIKELYDTSDKVHVAFVGEYNAGKSSLINTLLGKKVVAERDLPTTNRVVLITHCPVEKREKIDDFTELICVKDPRLEQTVLVDTPGLTSAVREHEHALMRYLHKADLIVVVAPSNQPYTKEIEELLKLLAKKHSTQLAYVINIFEDPEVYLEDPEKLTRLKEFVRERLRNILSAEDVERMPIFAFSIRAVRKSAEGGYDFLTKEWENFRRFIFEEVISRAKKIKQNALKEKILKTLASSSELEEIKLKVEKNRTELQRLEDLKAGVEEFLNTQREEKKERVASFVEGVFEKLTSEAELVQKHSWWDFVKNPSAVVEGLKDRFSALLGSESVKEGFLEAVDYRPVLLRLKKLFPEVKVEPTIPPRLEETFENFKGEIIGSVEKLAKFGELSKTFAALFFVVLLFAGAIALFAKSEGWRVAAAAVALLSGLGLVVSLGFLFTAKGRFVKKLRSALEQARKKTEGELTDYTLTQMDRRFASTLADVEAMIEQLKVKINSLEKYLKKLEEIKERLVASD